MVMLVAGLVCFNGICKAFMPSNARIFHFTHACSQFSFLRPAMLFLAGEYCAREHKRDDAEGLFSPPVFSILMDRTLSI
jgi:hypothetical protein